MIVTIATRCNMRWWQNRIKILQKEYDKIQISIFSMKYSVWATARKHSVESWRPATLLLAQKRRRTIFVKTKIKKGLLKRTAEGGRRPEEICCDCDHLRVRVVLKNNAVNLAYALGRYEKGTRNPANLAALDKLRTEIRYCKDRRQEKGLFITYHLQELQKYEPNFRFLSTLGCSGQRKSAGTASKNSEGRLVSRTLKNCCERFLPMDCQKFWKRMTKFCRCPEFWVPKYNEAIGAFSIPVHRVAARRLESRLLEFSIWCHRAQPNHPRLTTFTLPVYLMGVVRRLRLQWYGAPYQAGFYEYVWSRTTLDQKYHALCLALRVGRTHHCTELLTSAMALCRDQRYHLEATADRRSSAATAKAVGLIFDGNIERCCRTISFMMIRQSFGSGSCRREWQRSNIYRADRLCSGVTG